MLSALRPRWLAVLACALVLAAEDTPRHAGARVLAHGPMRIEVMDPAAPERYNRGVRFTPLAAVLRATWRGHELLFDPLEHDPVDDHAGLASEFDLCIPGGPAADLPPGWVVAPVGGAFLKIGVGLLAKEAGPAYDLFQHPRPLRLATTTVAWTADGAAFRQVCAGPDGWAYELDADLTVEDDRIAVAWRLADTGSRPFATRQYAHNFLCFDGRPVGPDYALSFPCAVTVTGAAAEQETAADGVRFVREIPRWVNLEVALPAGWAEPARCSLRHAVLGLELTCAVSLPAARMAVHARPAYCAPEQFVAIALAPGEERRWTRTWSAALSR